MKKILAVDDKKDNLTTIKAVLKANIPDCKVFTALTGKEGLSIAKNVLPDIIILDVIMPLMDGYEVCEILKADELTKHIPVIMLTAIRTDTKSRVKGLSIGADAFLSKPIDTVEFIAQVNVMFRIKKAEDKLRAEKNILDEKVTIKSRELFLSDNKLKLFSESATDHFSLWSADLNLLEINKNAMNLFYPETKIEEIIGKNIIELNPDIKKSGRYDEYIKVLKTGTTFNIGELKTYIKGKKVLLSLKVFKVGKGLGMITSDITERKKSEIEIKKMSEIALDLVDFPLDKDIYDFIAVKIKEFIGPGVVVLNLIDQKKKLLQTHKVLGLSESSLKIFNSILGSKFTDISFKDISSEALNIFASGKLNKIDGGLYEVLFKTVPEILCEKFEKQFAIKEVYAIGLRRKGEIFCNITIFTQKNTRLNAEIIETFANQASISLSRRSFENELIQSNDRFRKFTTLTFEGIAFHDNGIVIDLNDALLKIFGYKREEIIGKNLMELLIPEEYYHIINEKGIYESVKPYQVMAKRKNGNLFNLEIESNQVIFNGKKIRVAAFRDISDRVRTEQIQKVLYNISNASLKSDNLEKLILRIQEELSKIIDTRNFYIALYNKDTDTLSLPFFTDQEDEYTNFPAGKTLTYYVIKTKKSLLANDKLIKELEAAGELESYGSDSKIWLGVPLKTEGEITGVLAVQSYTDENAYSESDLEMLEFVSDQISISIERKKAEQDVILALEKAKESDRLKSSFLACMSHELRTPLNAVIGFSDIIDEDLPIDEIIDFVKTINSSGNHLLSIVEDIFDITLIDAGEIKFFKNSFSLNSVLKDVYKIIFEEQKRIEKDNIELKLLLNDDSKDVIIYTDKQKLKQILINLLKNALKFTFEGYISCGYHIEKDQDKSVIKFYVQDTGIGIKKEKQKFIFDIFRQVEDTHTRRFGGIGIGLSISKKLTELLGGRIWLDSEFGKGSTFYFTIPYEKEI